MQSSTKLAETVGLFAFQCRVDQIMTSKKQDIGAIRVLPHTAMPNGYPVVDIQDYAEVHEGLEVGTCGFPLGNFLKGQIGAVTSSFTFGRISTVSPFEGVEESHLEAFQLDMTATHGNSGGPVFHQNSQKVIGVLQSGIMHPKTGLLPGLVRCEPVYGILGDNVVDFLKSRLLGQIGDIADLKKLQN